VFPEPQSLHKDIWLSTRLRSRLVVCLLVVDRHLSQKAGSNYRTSAALH
jgi:hypothetical protein